MSRGCEDQGLGLKASWSGGMPRKGTKQADPEALAGLAQLWEKCRPIRQNLLSTGNVLSWPSPNLVGVVTFQTASHNYAVLSRTLRHWLPKIQILKTINIFAARKEVWGSDCYFLKTIEEPS